MTRYSAFLMVLLGGSAVVGCKESAGGPDQLLSPRVGEPQPVQFSQTISMPLGASTTTEVTGCDNSPGPFITISGALTIGGLGSRLTFTNNVKGTHTFTNDASVDVTVIPSGGSITIPKQPVEGGVGGNPFIWIQLEDGNGQAITGEVFLGRCVQGLRSTTSADFSSIARALATITVADCSNSPGPFITVDGDLLVNAGLDAVFIFRNNDNPVGGPHRANADAVVTVELVPPGHDIRFNKQPSRGGVGGNPWIWFNFLSSAGEPLGDPSLLGRCEQLSKA